MSISRNLRRQIHHFVSGDFSAKRQKNSPAPHVYKSEQARLPELIVSHNLELRLRDGENGWRHILCFDKALKR